MSCDCGKRLERRVGVRRYNRVPTTVLCKSAICYTALCKYIVGATETAGRRLRYLRYIGRGTIACCGHATIIIYRLIFSLDRKPSNGSVIQLF